MPSLLASSRVFYCPRWFLSETLYHWQILRLLSRNSCCQGKPPLPLMSPRPPAGRDLWPLARGQPAGQLDKPAGHTALGLCSPGGADPSLQVPCPRGGLAVRQVTRGSEPLCGLRGFLFFPSHQKSSPSVPCPSLGLQAHTFSEAFSNR